MARYLIRAPYYRGAQPGEPVGTATHVQATPEFPAEVTIPDGEPPGRDWEPLDEAARIDKEKYRARIRGLDDLAARRRVLEERPELAAAEAVRIVLGEMKSAVVPAPAEQDLPSVQVPGPPPIHELDKDPPAKKKTA